jgi:hypothetical protein
MITHEYIGSLVAAARVRKRLTQSALGQMMNPPRTHAAVSDIERGRTRLNLVELHEMASLLAPEMDETLRLLSPFTRVTCTHMTMRCIACGQEWTAG